ncbi:MAG: YqgE/AlgH family protein [Gammaproteobacteria bacterium]|nr:YqgE/AlgH family protein [Gammaproteobacteria bacterium]
MSDPSTSLRSQILIAMPTLYDPSFSKTITLICEHSAKEGAMGIVLNQPTSLDIHELMEAKKTKQKDNSLHSIKIHSGGPVDTNHGFILHDCETNDDLSIQIAPRLFLSSSTGIIEKIAQGEGPDNQIIALGYASWSPGQLETEITANSWLTTDYEHKLVFETPANIQWIEAGKRLGIDLNLLTTQAGHA